MAGPDRGQQRRALDQLVPGQRVQPAGRRALQLVVGPTDPLQERADGPGRADLADQLDRARRRCRARATRSPPAPAARRPAAGPRRDGGARPTGCRGGRRPAGLARRRLRAVAVPSPSRRSASWWATRSASLRVFTNTRVVRCCADVVGDPVEDLAELVAAGRPPRARRRAARWRRRGRGGGRSRRWPASAGRRRRRRAAGPPPRAVAGWPTARSAAAGRRPPSATRWASRSRLRARWLPRLSRARVWTSSTMTVRTSRSIDRDDAAVSSR